MMIPGVKDNVSTSNSGVGWAKNFCAWKAAIRKVLSFCAPGVVSVTNYTKLYKTLPSGCDEVVRMVIPEAESYEGDFQNTGEVVYKFCYRP